jgi:hypothetical protein
MPGVEVTAGFGGDTGPGDAGAGGDDVTAGFAMAGGPGGAGGGADGGGTVVGLKRTPLSSSGITAATVGESKSGPLAGAPPRLLVGGAFVAIVGISSWGVCSVGGASLSEGRAGSVTGWTLAHL